MARFFLPPAAWSANPSLTGEEARHCAQVLRAAPGDMVEVFDGHGRRAQARVARVARDRVELELGAAVCAPAGGPQVVLWQAVPKGKTMDLVVQKAVELGAAAVQPVLTTHTVVRLDEDDGPRKAEKWQRVALEACKQCGQDVLPFVHQPESLERAIASAPRAALRLIASLAPGSLPMRDCLPDAPPASVDVLIGPEGDFTQAETELALAAGFVPVSLGHTVLRAETAAFFCLAALRFQWGY